jgi:hypothetical protein
MKLKFEYECIEKYGKIGLTIADMSILLNIPEKVIEKMMMPGKKFYQYYKRGQVQTKCDLLSSQLSVAMGKEKGNPMMLALLGEVLLGQTSKDAKAEQNTEDDFIKNLPKDVKEQLFRALTGITDDREVIDDGYDDIEVNDEPLTKGDPKDE